MTANAQEIEIVPDERDRKEKNHLLCLQDTRQAQERSQQYI